MSERPILAFVPFALNTPHFETDLELLQEQCARGRTVHVLVCNAALPSCELNPTDSLTTCATCIARRQEGLAALDRGSGRIALHSLLELTGADHTELGRLPRRFDSLAQLERFTFREFDAGLAVFSSIVSTLRNPAPSVVEHADAIYSALLSSCAVYLSSLNWIARLRPDEAFVYNGRFTTQRAFLRACQASSVTCFTHDRGATLTRYALFRDAMPHDLTRAERRIQASWDAAPREEARAIGDRFFQDRARGKIYNFVSYISAQEPELLPTPWPAGRLKVGIFLSSEDEYVAIGPEWKNPLYESQWKGLFAILADLGIDDRFHVYVRCHPNSARVTDPNFDRLHQLAGALPNVTVIAPTSPVSTYGLLRAVDRVISFGSTVGIEATYWRKPSILAGNSFYRGLGGAYLPADHAELLDLLRAEDLPPKAMDAALMYGFDQSTYGTPFRYYEASGVSSGRFKGKDLGAHLKVHRALRALARIPGVSAARAHLRAPSRTLLLARLLGLRSSLRRTFEARLPGSETS